MHATSVQVYPRISILLILCPPVNPPTGTPPPGPRAARALPSIFPNLLTMLSHLLSMLTVVRVAGRLVLEGKSLTDALDQILPKMPEIIKYVG